MQPQGPPVRERRTPPQIGIRLLREAYGLTIPALAARIAENGVNVTADHISNVELGWKRPSNALLHAWARALGVSPLDIWSDPDSGRSVEQVPA